MVVLKGFERYGISEKGLIFSFISCKYLKPVDNGGGYKSVILRSDGKSYHKYIHRLVGEAYLGLTSDKEINHIDGDKSNNSLENLEVVTRLENIEHSYTTGLAPIGSAHKNSKLTEEKVIEILELLSLDGCNKTGIGRSYGVTFTIINRIAKGTAWKHVVRSKKSRWSY